MAAMGSEPIVVADVGSCFARVGLAGASTPAAVCHSIVGKPKYRRVLKGATSAPADGQLVCGDAAMSQRALLALRRPATADGVADVSDWLALWDHVLASTDSAAKGGGGSLSSAAVALVAPRCASTAVQAGLVQALLASRKHSRVRLVNPAAAALYSAGLTTGVALDVGHTGSAAVPILDGFAVPTAARRSRAGGASVVHTVRESLRQQGLHLDLPSEVEVAREIAEAVSQCGADPKQAVPGKYQLPDGSMLAVPSEAIRAGDCLFSPGNPDEPGLHTIVAACVAATDLHARASLLNNVVMYGGGSLYTGAPQAFLNNLAASVPRGVNVSVRASKDRFMAPWTGASVLTALEYKAEEGSWLTAGDIEEHGAVRAVERMHW